MNYLNDFDEKRLVRDVNILTVLNNGKEMMFLMSSQTKNMLTKTFNKNCINYFYGRKILIDDSLPVGEVKILTEANTSVLNNWSKTSIKNKYMEEIK